MLSYLGKIKTKLSLLLFFIPFISLFSSAGCAEQRENPNHAIAVTAASENEQLNDIREALNKHQVALQKLLESLPTTSDGNLSEKIESSEISKIELAVQAIRTEAPESLHVIDSRLESLESSLNNYVSKDKYFNYADMAAIAIACVAVLLTVVGLAIAGLAFWGYKEIKEITKNSAAHEAKVVAQKTVNETIHNVAKSELEQLINDGKLQETLQNAVDMIIRQNPDNPEKDRVQEILSELDSEDR